MSSFFRRSRDEAPEVREASTAEIADRAARLRALDQEIERRDALLRHSREGLTEEIEPASQVESEQVPPPPVDMPENGSRNGVNEQLAGIEQVLRETVSALAARVEALETRLEEAQRQAEDPTPAGPALSESIEGRLAELEAASAAGGTDVDRLSALAARVEALETSVQETQRRGVAELRAEQASMKEVLEQRLSGLEAAAAEAAEGEDRASALAARVDALEMSLQETQRRSVEELRIEQELIKELLEQRLSGLEAAAAEAARGDDRAYALAARMDALETGLQETQRKSVEEEAFGQRLAGIDAAITETSRSSQATESRLGATLEELSMRIEKVDVRLAAAEQSASASGERLRMMAELLLDRTSDQQENPDG